MDYPDLIYKSEQGKFKAVFDEIIEAHQKGQPVLVGTVSVEKSEVLASLLRKKNVPFAVLNAKQHGREAGVVAQAGRKGAITISTNMAGRGTDIVLGGNAEALAQQKWEAEKPKEGADDTKAEQARYDKILKDLQVECEQEKKEVLAAGGLKIVGTERHESRRIDNQLRGRAGRQGDPGASRFYLSLDDDLMRIFGADRIRGLMEKMGMEEDVPIEHKWVTKAIENAQKKVEGRNFDMRKNVLEYDDVMNQQRKTIYGLREQILLGQYYPELSEEEVKSGVVPQPPEVSGDWTKDSLRTELTVELTEQINTVLDEAESKVAAQQAKQTAADSNQQVPLVAPPWRELRHEIWRTTGCFCKDMQRYYQKSRQELTSYVVDSVVASLIQQRERMLDLADTLIGYHIANFCPPNASVDEWNLDGLEETLQDQFNFAVTLDRDNLDPNTMASFVWQQVEKRLEERKEELTRPWLFYFLRSFYLQEIDSQWIDHLKTMDQLREGIHLRGYGQKDPKKEYKKEGFEIFRLMMDQVLLNAGDKLCKVRFKSQEEQIPTLSTNQRKTIESHDGANVYGKASDGGATAEKAKTVRRDKPKVGRNDPCPCGSGKKYKKCHGSGDAGASA